MTMSSVAEVAGLRRSARFATEPIRRVASRLRRNQGPAATAADMQRSASALADAALNRIVAESWGWS